MKHIKVKDEKLEITPFDIDISKHFWNAFDHSETEVSANWIVKLCQKKGSWGPFSHKEIEDLYKQKFKDGFTFNKLISDGWIIKDSEMYHMTVGFIVRCFESSPKEEE